MSRPFRRNSQFALPLILLLAGFGYFSASTIIAPASSTSGQAVQPWPDGAEYLDAAVSLVRGGSYSIHIAGEEHPPRYPFGHSLWIAGALLLGADAGEAPHLANTIAGAILMALIAAIFWRRSQRLEAGLAVLLLATLPAFVILCRSPMSEITSTLIAVLGVYCLYRYARDGQVLSGSAGAFLLGLGLCFRTSSVLLAVFIPAAILARFVPSGIRQNLRPAIRDILLLGLSLGLGWIPALVYSAVTFGHPLATGYGYWSPFWNASTAFDSKFFEPNLIYYWREFAQIETEFTSATTYSHGLSQGSYFTPAFPLLVLLSLWLLRRHPRLLLFAMAGFGYQLATMFYFFKDARLAFPIMVLAVLLIARALGNLSQRGDGAPRWRGFKIALALPLVLATVIGWPASGGGFETLTLLQNGRAPLPASVTMDDFLQLEIPPPGLVLTDMAPPYVHALLPEGTIVAPLNHDHLYRHNPDVFLYQNRQRGQLLQDALTAEQDVWVLVGHRDIFSLAEVLAPPEGLAWEVVSSSGVVGGIARLVRVGG